jgi:hypothetical protein
MAREEGLHTLEARQRAGQGNEVEEVIDCAHISPSLDHAGDEKGLDFRGEQEPFPIGSALPRPEERADAQAIAGQ